MITACNWMDFTCPLEGNRFTRQDSCSHCGDTSVHICNVLCMVMGSSWLVNSKWNLPNGNKNSRICLRSELKHDFHFHHCSGIPVNAMPPASLHFLLLLCLDSCNGDFCCIPIAGDQGRPDRLYGRNSMEAASSVEEILHGWSSQELWDGLNIHIYIHSRIMFFKSNLFIVLALYCNVL